MNPGKNPLGWLVLVLFLLIVGPFYVIVVLVRRFRRWRTQLGRATEGRNG